MRTQHTNRPAVSGGMIGVVNVQTATMIAWLRMEAPATVAVFTAVEMIDRNDRVVDTGLAIGTADGRVYVVELLRDRLLLDAAQAGAGADVAYRKVRIVAEGEDTSKLRLKLGQGSTTHFGYEVSNQESARGH